MDNRQLIRSSVEPRRVIYGRARVSGPIVYAESSGQYNENLSIVFPVAGHACEGWDGIWLNDTWVSRNDVAGNEVVSGPMAGKVVIFWYDGTQEGSDVVLTESSGPWSSSDLLLGCAYFHVMMRYDENLFRGGVPNISALVVGKSDVYDPRTGGAQYSNLWALCILDYLRSPYGLNCADDEIDFDYFSAAANISGEVIAINEEGTDLQQRYTLDGSFQMDRTPIDVMEEMIASGGGALVYVQGKYRLYAGAYSAPTVTITASDLAGPVQMQPQPALRDRFNAIRGTYINNQANYTAADFPKMRHDDAIAVDGEEIVRDIDLPWCRDAVQAQRIAVMMLKRHIDSLTVTVPLRYASLNICVMDVVAFTLPDFGWVGKPFRVISYTFDPATGIITVTMQEEQPAAYAWLPSEAARLPVYPDTNIVSPFSVPAPAGLAVTEQLYATRDGAGVRAMAVLTWSPLPSPFIVGHDIQFCRAGATDWRSAPGVAGDVTRGEILDLGDGDWRFRIRARTAVASGAWTETGTYIGGLAALPPADITSLSGQIAGGMLWLRWARHPDLDVRAGGHIEFRHHPDPGSVWANATSIGEAAAGNVNFTVLPLRAGTYFAKAVDAGGRYSLNAATFFTLQEGALGYSALASQTYHPTFTGGYVGVVVSGGALQLEGLGTVDDAPDFDAIESVDAMGGIRSSGVSQQVGLNLGAAMRCRVTPTLRATIVNSFDQWDSRAGPFDSWTSVDGVAGGEADAWVEVRWTTDDPTGTPTYTAWQRLDAGEFCMWHMQVRVQLRSYDPAFNIAIDQLSIVAEQVT